MLLKHPRTSVDDHLPAWLDLLSPTHDERRQAEGETGFTLPTLDQLNEIETSSRLKFRKEVLVMSMPMIAHGESQPRRLAPIGFVLSQDRLVTIRFSGLKSFDDVARDLETADDAPYHSLEVFVRLCEEMVDRLADALEGLAASLDDLSTAIFDPEASGIPKRDRANTRLREQLKRVGQMGDRASDTRDALLGLGRILAFVEENGKHWNGGRCAPRIASLRQDVHSLTDYDVQLGEKVQFLLDALVGMIGIAQNDVFRILTIVSIIGIPPTLVASIYGMNFKGMPELSWTYGYPYGLAVIAASAIIPLAWFRWRGWF